MVDHHDTRDSRLWLWLGIGGSLTVVAMIVGWLVLFGFGGEPTKRVQQEFVVVTLPPPPPPPPPPPEQQPQPEEKVEQQIAEPEIKEEKPSDKPPDEANNDPKKDDGPPPLDIGKNTDGPGQLYGGEGRGLGTAGGTGTGGSRWSRYAGMVQQQLEAAIRANPKTRNSVMQVQVRVWADRTGRVNRIVLVASTGNQEIDDAIRNEALAGLVLREPPPEDMPMPIITRITARRQT